MALKLIRRPDFKKIAAREAGLIFIFVLAGFFFGFLSKAAPSGFVYEVKTPAHVYEISKKEYLAVFDALKPEAVRIAREQYGENVELNDIQVTLKARTGPRAGFLNDLARFFFFLAYPASLLLRFLFWLLTVLRTKKDGSPPETSA